MQQQNQLTQTPNTVILHSNTVMVDLVHFTVDELDCSTDLNYWIKLLSCIIEANGGHIGLSHINYIGTIEVVEEVFTGLGYWWEWINIV